MSRTQELADEVRLVLKSGDLTLSDSLRQLSDEFSVVSRQVDTRLRRCTEFLNKGLRVEAIDLADQPPKLLEEIAVLSFPDRKAWDNLVADYGLAKTATPDQDRAMELSKAYTAQIPLLALTQKLRAMSRARSHAADRLPILWQLNELDANNPMWIESIELFEADAHKHLSTSAEQAIASGDLHKADLMFERLTSPNWKNAPPQNVVQRLAVATLPLLCERLDNALSKRNRMSYVSLLNTTTGRLQASGLAESDPRANYPSRLIRKAEAADLEEFKKDEYQRLLEDAARLMQDPTSIKLEVEEVYSKILLYNEPLPRKLEKLYEEWQDSQRGKREGYYNMAAIGLLAVGLIFIVGLIFLLKSK